MKTKKYIAPKIEVIVIETEDVISSSEKKPSFGDNQWGGGISQPATRTNLNGKKD